MGTHTLNTHHGSHALITWVQNFRRPWNWDGKTKGKHGIQGAALSHVTGMDNPRATLRFLRTSMAAQVFPLGHIRKLWGYWKAATFLLNLQLLWTGSFLIGDIKHFHSANPMSEPSHGQVQVIHCHGLSTCPPVKQKTQGRVIHVKVTVSFNHQSLIETKFLSSYNIAKYTFLKYHKYKKWPISILLHGWTLLSSAPATFSSSFL